MQEMLYPTSYLKGVGLGPKCALITDGRFSGGSSGLSLGPVSYTHLDVYKRQAMVQAVDRNVSDESIQTCLLYTSRCV